MAVNGKNTAALTFVFRRLTDVVLADPLWESIVTWRKAQWVRVSGALDGSDAPNVRAKRSTMLTFRPHPSLGWTWLVLIGLLMLAIPAWTTALASSQAPVPIILLNLAIGLGIGVPALVLAAWFPTMRYELDEETLTLR